MFTRRIFLSGLILILALLTTFPVLAGGWAVITLDKWIDSPSLQEPTIVGFTVRQHGIQPMSGLTPTILLKHQETGETMLVRAEPQGKTGHYQAEIDFPKAGAWQWSIQACAMDQAMPPLTVVDGSSSFSSNAPSRPAPSAPFLFLAGAGLAVALAGALSLRRGARWALALLLIGLLASTGSFAAAARQAGRSEAPTVSANTTQQELGENLFIAKGCVTCHAHRGIKTAGGFSLDVGPDLSTFTASPDYLRTWLKDPQTVKPNTQMPDLELRETEIEALIAFINSDGGK